jgi:hypothetical protein
MLTSLFLSHQHSLIPGGGGQQQCTREYRTALTAAGFDLVDCTFDTDRSLTTRLRRKLRPSPYANLIPDEFLAKVSQAVDRHAPEFIFCNLFDFIPAVPQLRKALGERARLVLLSHGLASVDEVHAARIARRQLPDADGQPVADERVAAMLRVESEGLPLFDHVFCLSSFEVEICRWLGARSVTWLPRTIDAGLALPWRPVGDRLGCVGTFDHPPNLEGLEDFCAALMAIGPGALRLRVVSRSRTVVASLRQRYPFIDDLGPLEAPGEVEGEAATWNAFVHPIFCYAMGASTKTATGFSWGLPVLTTSAGLRGYVWKAGDVPVTETAADMARHALAMRDLTRAAAFRDQVLLAARSAPSIADVASQIRADLGMRTIREEQLLARPAS